MLFNYLQSPELGALRPGQRRAKLTVFTPRRFTLARSTCNWAYPPNCRQVDRCQNPEHVVRPKSHATFRQHALARTQIHGAQTIPSNQERL
jgi:hypothetical protein